METTQTILTVFIWFLCPILILLILVQGGAGDLSSTFGGGGQLDSTLGVGASRKMGKLTGWMSVAFLAIVLFMAIPTGGAFDTYGAGAPTDGGEEVLDDPAQPPPTVPAPTAGIDPVTAPVEEGPAAAVDQPAAEAQPAAEEAVEPEADKQEAGMEIDVGAQPADED